MELLPVAGVAELDDSLSEVGEHGYSWVVSAACGAMDAA